VRSTVLRAVADIDAPLEREILDPSQ